MKNLNKSTLPHPADMKASYHRLNLYLSDLDESEQKAIHQDWRFRLINFCDELRTSAIRRDWFFHQLMQEQDLLSLVSLVDEFNSLQLKDLHGVQELEISLDFFQMEISQAGLFLAKTTYIDSHPDINKLHHAKVEAELLSSQVS